MIELHNVEISGKFRYLWLKYVTGYNLDQHCAKSLKGEYSSRIGIENLTADKIILDEFPAKIIYLCGVAKPYNWAKNFHLALMAHDGGEFHIYQLGVRLTVRNAVPLPVETTAMRANNHEKIKQKAYCTCRNWQFANFLHLTGILCDGQ